MDATTELRKALDRVLKSTEALTAAVRDLQQLIAVEDHEREQWAKKETLRFTYPINDTHKE